MPYAFSMSVIKINNFSSDWMRYKSRTRKAFLLTGIDQQLTDRLILFNILNHEKEIS